MKNISSVLLISALAFNQSCTTMKQTDIQQELPAPDPSLSSNPFMKKSKLQYEAPEFDKIKNEHFKPAFNYGLKQHEAEIIKIANNPAAPTFENTIVALEKSGEVLRRAQIVFSNLTSANTNPTLQTLDEEYAPIFAAHSDKLYLNENLYKRIQSIKEDGLDSESKRLVQYYKQNFEIAGANLSAADKEKLKQLNQELASLSTQYSNKLLEARKQGGVFFSDAKELDGLSADEIAAAAADAKTAGQPGKYLLALQNTTQQPLLQNLKNRATREKLFKASWTRAEKGDANDTRSTIEQLAKLRLKKAQILGKKNFAEWKLQDQMAKTPEAATKLMNQIATPAVETARREAKDIQDLIDQQKGGFKVEPWDWNFYAEQVRKAKFDLDESEIKPYFEITTVLEKGVFFAAEKFYGLTFKKRTDLPVYHPDVVTYEVFDHDGKSIAIYYLDFYTRDSKNGGAWMSNFVEQSYLLGTKPVIVNCYNYQKPAPGKPSLISYDDVSTIFHEFGHSIHGMFASQKYPSLSGTNVPRDFVEFPSQINEHWALDPVVLKNYAVHYETKQPIPQALVDKIKKASTFNQGYMTTELVSAAELDMDWHTVSNESQFIPVLDFEKQSLASHGFNLATVPPRYHTPYFAHIWGGGYSAGYYAYLWSETLDNDAWEWISKNGGLTRENGDRFRKYILSVGNSVDLNQAFRDFTGHDPDIKPLLRNRGFIK
ncbi:peptidyl-dipeptidase Dcp [Chryseobacterium bernardetii]|uniref:Dipeptidyl carboxypeptidase n=2 Tax=Chryseobacterium TaxID=59732 RepID=A0A543E919_9FLAO|nr:MULTISPECIES: M3 family metallopeptidase [Chryseobacterium]MDR6371674.1 peptidyl-dipeptidase Dcp [Chryseobacterium vietnamense]MDR6443162.1 peptidyl-dipeptidase Dcp [Chryseobacterium bernardetii]TQM18093.1 peptidyl-dipeptidase Dcp [Chryseobacterium aquifrigidense]